MSVSLFKKPSRIRPVSIKEGKSFHACKKYPQSTEENENCGNVFKADTAVFLYMLKLLSGGLSDKRQEVAGHWLQIRFVESGRVTH
jgi:hypothetical protein